MSAQRYEEDGIQQIEPKKRRITGRTADVGKKLRLCSHEIGNACKCFRLICFEVTTEAERAEIIREFNSLETHNDQNAYLAGLITVLPVQKRRPRHTEEIAKLRDAAFAYRVRVFAGSNQMRDIPVCAKAFCAIHGITKNKLEYIQKSLKMTGCAPRDKRGKHSSLHRKLPASTRSLIYNHTNSFKGRQNHYSLKDSKKVYLPEELNVKKMFSMFKELHSTVDVSYETYRSIMNMNFNISFGYPRSDTCTHCDEFSAKLKALSPEEDKEEIKKLTTLNVFHKKKAETFYRWKREARHKSMKTRKMEAICMDFAKNVSTPNISTNDVYYKRQLSVYTFNIHILSTGKSVFYVYHEGIAKNGPNEVASFLLHFIMNHLDDEVEELLVFCDSAGGQNKNFTIFRFIHYIVSNIIHGVKNIKITFPERGHSYMECDKNVGLWKLKERMETSEEFISMIENSRIKPSPFVVERVCQEMVYDWKQVLDQKYVLKCPFKTQPIKEIEASSAHPRLLNWKATYNGAMVSSIIRKPAKSVSTQKTGEFELPSLAYSGLSSRPKRLLLFVNPYGGKQRGLKIYEKQVKPLLAVAGVDAKLVVTQRANHARDALLTACLDNVDGVACVGGDGTFAEVFNGLVLRTARDLGIDHNDPEARLPPLPLRVGVIPGGSTDTMAYCFHGTTDVQTAVLHIILGDSRGIDLCSVHSNATLLQYFSSVISYGYLGDVLRDSEKFRWMGPKRYEYSGFKKFMANKGYEGEITLLADGSDASEGPKCWGNCERCAQHCETKRPKNAQAQGEWKTFRGKYFMVCGANVSCACTRSPQGIAPNAHLGDGCVDVILIRHTNLFNNLRLLLRFTSKTKDVFTLPFVEVHRAREFSFRPVPSPASAVEFPPPRLIPGVSVWNCDGEIQWETNMRVRVHCQLLQVFSRGIPELEQQSRKICCF